MVNDNDTRPQRGMLIGLAIGSVPMVVLPALFYEHMHKPGVQVKPNQAPLATQN